ncbi:sigma-70 family RNA polymerase sigma factor [Paractinoplanes brasiliensis]|nr:sigma-70 family RNA polymerase sigma factor [Actinoplanes brasiliensis]
MPTTKSARRRDMADEAFVRSLFAEHGRAMLGYAYQLTRDRAAAEDIVQEALVRAWRHADDLGSDGKGSVRGWLLTVVRNLFHDQVRARSRRAPETFEAPPDVATERDHADQVVASMVVIDALARLSSEHRAALELTYLHGYGIAEAAEVLGVPPGTVKSRVFHGLRALRDLHAADETMKERSVV